MKLLAVSCNKIASKIIRYGTGEKASHFAICFDKIGNLVYHSLGFSGLVIDHPGIFYGKYKVVEEIYVDIDNELEFHNQFIKLTYNVKYDHPAFSFLLYHGILKKIFDSPFPKINSLDTQNRYLCTELFYPWYETYGIITGKINLIEKHIASMTVIELMSEIRKVLGK